MLEGKVVGVVSSKGGAGKTVFVANLAFAMSSVFGRRILAVDGNLEAPNLGLCFNLPHPPLTLRDALEDKIPIEEAIYQLNEKMDLILGYLMNEATSRKAKLGEKIQFLLKKYDFILIDSCTGVDEDVMKASDELLVITEPDRLSVTTVYKLIKAARENELKIRVILNKVRGSKGELEKSAVEATLAQPVASVIPYDPRVIEAVNKGVSVLQLSPNSPASKSYKKLAADLLGEELREGIIEKTSKALKKLKIKAPSEEEVEIRVEVGSDEILAKKKVIETALNRLFEYYERGLILEDVYKDLKRKYLEELEQLDSQAQR
jgi:septum site-determining protein MinD